MSERLENLVFPYALGDGYVEEFCYSLRDDHGFDIGPIELEQILRLVAALEATGRRIKTAKDAVQLLSPILARDPEDQRALRQIIATDFANAGLEHTDFDDTAETSETAASAVVAEHGTAGTGKSQRTWFDYLRALAPLFVAVIVIVVLALIALALLGWDSFLPRPDPDPPDCDGPAAQRLVECSADEVDDLIILLRWLFSNPITATVIVTCATLFAILRSVLFRIRRYAAQRDGVPDNQERYRPLLTDAGPIFFTSNEDEDQVARLTGHILVATRNLNAAETALSTVSKGGFLTLVQSDRKVQPEFTILFDRTSARDQMQILVEDLHSAIAKQHVHVDRFDYANLPERPIEIGRDGVPRAAVNFDAIVAKAMARHILLVAHPDGLVRSPRKLVPWLARLAREGQVTVLSPVPFDQLRRPLGVFHRMGISVRLAWDFDRPLPENAFGGRIAGYLKSDVTMTSNFAPEPREQAALSRWLRRSFSVRAQEFLAALSIYPEISVPMTRALLARLRGEDRRLLVDSGVLGEVIGLSWMRNARMPEWAMKLVRRQISPERRNALRDDVQSSLVPDPQGRGSISLTFDKRLFSFSWLHGVGPDQGQLNESVVGRPSWRQSELAVYVENALQQKRSNPITLLRLSLLLIAVVSVPVLQALSEVELLETWAARLPTAMANLTLVVAIALHMVALSKAQHETRQNLIWVAVGGLLCAIAQSFFGEAPSEPQVHPPGEDTPEKFYTTLVLSAGLFVAFLARGAPGTSRAIQDVFSHMSWVMAGALLWAASFVAIGTYELGTTLKLGTEFPMLGAALVVVSCTLLMAWPLRAPLRDHLLLSILAGVLAHQIPFDLISGAVSSHWISEEWAAVFAKAGAAGVLATAVFAHLDWRGALASQGPWWRPLAIGAVFAALNLAASVSAKFGVPIFVAHLYFPVFLTVALAPDRAPPPPFWLGAIAGPALAILGFAALFGPVNFAGLTLVTASIGVLLAPAFTLWAFPDLFRAWRASVFPHAWPSPTVGQRASAVGAALLFLTVFSFEASVGLLLFDFTFLAIPFAGLVAYRLGRAGFWAVAIGGIGFWVQFDFGIFSSNQTPAIYFACLLVARVVGSAELRHEIMKTAALTNWQLLFLTLGFATSLSYSFGNVSLEHTPQRYLEIVLVLIGLSRVRFSQIAPWLFWCWIVSFVFGIVYFDNIFGWVVRPTLRSVSDIVALGVCFIAGRAIRDLLVSPRAYDHLRVRLAFGLAAILLIDLISIEIFFDVGFFWGDIGFFINVVPWIAVMLGFLALGVIAGTAGVFPAIVLGCTFFVAIPVAMELFGFAVGFDLFPFSPISIARPYASLGVQYDLGNGFAVGVGYTLLTLVGIRVRRLLFERTGVSEVANQSLDRQIMKFVDLSANSNQAMGPQLEDVATLRPITPPNLPIADPALETRYMPDQAAALLGDYRALRARGRISSGGHPVLRALWLDRVAVFSGLLIVFYLPLGFAFDFLVARSELVVPETPIILPGIETTENISESPIVEPVIILEEPGICSVLPIFC